MNGKVLAFSGGIASGKSALSTGIAAVAGWPRVSFGDYVRQVTQTRGLEGNRKNWQAVGEMLIREDVDEFCRAVLAQARWKAGGDLVIDGVRHVEVLEALKSLLLPSRIYLVYVDVDEPSRDLRLRSMTSCGESLAELEQHSTEIAVRTALPRLAHLIVDGTRPMNDLVTEITRWAAALQ